MPPTRCRGASRSSANFQSLSGPELSAGYPLTNAIASPSLGRNFTNAAPTVALVPPGTLYGDRIYQTDIRFNKTIKAGRTTIRPTIDSTTCSTRTRSRPTPPPTGPPGWRRRSSSIRGSWISACRSTSRREVQAAGDVNDRPLLPSVGGSFCSIDVPEAVQLHYLAVREAEPSRAEGVPAWTSTVDPARIGWSASRRSEITQRRAKQASHLVNSCSRFDRPEHIVPSSRRRTRYPREARC